MPGEAGDELVGTSEQLHREGDRYGRSLEPLSKAILARSSGARSAIFRIGPATAAPIRQVGVM